MAAAGLIPYLMSLDPSARSFVARQTESEANRALSEAERAKAGTALGLVPQLQMADPSTRAFVTSDASKVAQRRLQSTTATPAATVNAVAGADAALNNAGSGVDVGADVGTPNPNKTRTALPGGSVGAGLPAGISRIDMPGEAPLYTNKGAAGYEEMRGVRSPLPSVTSALRNVPEMMSVINPQKGGGLVSPEVGGSGPTFISGTNGPTILGGGVDRIAEMDAQIDKYMRPGSSVFDMWRGRQLEKRRDRMMLHESLATNALANMTNAVTARQRASDALTTAQMTADAHRYAADQTAAAHRFSTAAELLKNKGQIMLNERIQAALGAGNTELAQQLSTLSHPVMPYGAPTDLSLSGLPGFLAQPNKQGGVNVVDVKALVTAQAAQAKAQREEEEAQRRAAGGK